MKIFTLIVILCSLIVGTTAVAKEKVPQDLNAKVAAIAKRYHSQIGVTATHIERNKTFAFNGAKHFFMASTVKVPIAITLLKNVDQGKENLDRTIIIQRNDCVPGSGRLYNDLCHCTTVTMSLKELMKLMLIHSDNTATDLILHEIKGPKTVANHLQLLGFQHIFIHRSILDMYLSASGLNVAIAKKVENKERLSQMLERVSPTMKFKAWKRFESEKSDSATSNDMANLLVNLYKGKLLSANSTHLLLGMMSQCQTGNHRIKGLLPPNTVVAHKTGTWALSNERFTKHPGSKNLNRFSNDVGIITLPNGQGHIAIAFFVKSSSAGDHQRDHVIALVTRDIYNHFLRNGTEHKSGAN